MEDTRGLLPDNRSVGQVVSPSPYVLWHGLPPALTLRRRIGRGVRNPGSYNNPRPFFSTYSALHRDFPNEKTGRCCLISTGLSTVSTVPAGADRSTNAGRLHRPAGAGENIQGKTAPGGWSRQGKVKWFNAEKGYGFIEGEDGGDGFVHYTAIATPGCRTWNQGEPVEFEMSEGPRGLRPPTWSR
ncbi:MAG TPA: hypothetical protein DCM14_07580 [Clostridiales bacterium UBA8153]|nr:hypothetical protein [Clostridiales bacterium UBA8153]